MKIQQYKEFSKFSAILLISLVFMINCRNKSKKTSTYVSKMTTLTYTLDSIISQEPNFDCNSLIAKFQKIVTPILEGDTSLYDIGLGLTLGKSSPKIEDICEGGIARVYNFYRENGVSFPMNESATEQFDTQNFGKCFFEKSERYSKIPLQKNGISYYYILELKLQSEKKVKGIYAPVITMKAYLSD